MVAWDASASSRDIDAFASAQPGPTPGDVRPLATALRAALTTGGWATTTIRDHPTFCRMLASKDREEVEIDLAVDSPPLFPTEDIGGIPILAESDLAARKVLAILDRAEGRDFTDLQALQATLGRDRCITWAKDLDAGISNTDVAAAFAKLERLADTELPTPNPAGTRRLFTEWAAALGHED